MTPGFNDLQTVMDNTVRIKNFNNEIEVLDDFAFKECVCKDKSKCEKQKYLETSKGFQEKCIPTAKDLDITEVSRFLYLKTKTS